MTPTVTLAGMLTAIDMPQLLIPEAEEPLVDWYVQLLPSLLAAARLVSLGQASRHDQGPLLWLDDCWRSS